MKVLRSFWGIAILLLCSYFVPEAFACSCASISSPCVRFSGADAVFVGKVSTIEEERAETVRFGKTEKIRTSLTAHLQIQSGYKGLVSDQKNITVITGGNSGDCGYDFKVGERYLIFAYKAPSGLLYYTSICDGTRPLNQAKDYIELIEALLKNRPETRIFGELALYERDLGAGPMHMKPNGSLAGVRVEARGNGSVFFDTTGRDGRFRIKKIPPGNYEVRPILTPAYSGYLGMEASYEAEIGLPEKCGAEADLLVQENGVIRGRVLDWKGQPIGWNVEVSLITADSVSRGVGKYVGSSEYTEPDGSYEFNGLKAGKYIVGVGLLKAPNWRSPFSKVFYPVGLESRTAAVLIIDMGTKRNDVDIHLPPPMLTTVIRGYVFDKNGAPVKGANIEVFDMEYANEVDVPEVLYVTTPDGYFSITALQGRRYEVRAYLTEHFLEGSGSQSEPVPVRTDQSLNPVNLVLTKPGIFRTEK